jgi:hypothetical protein
MVLMAMVYVYVCVGDVQEQYDDVWAGGCVGGEWVGGWRATEQEEEERRTVQGMQRVTGRSWKDDGVAVH